MGKAATSRLSLLRRSNNRKSARPPSPQQIPTEPSSSNGEEDEGDRRKEAKQQNSWTTAGGKLYVAPYRKDIDWLVSTSTVYKLLLSIRTAASFWAIVSDCDEVYNYWEPLHLLLFGNGFQTWEYSPLYAIRSWLYIYIHFIPSQLLFPLLSTSKVAFFHVIRLVLGVFCLAGEVKLFESVAHKIGNRSASLFIMFSMFSVGMFNSGCAFLPSSFSMIMNCLAMAAYLREKWFWAILCTCVSALVGWPFAAILGLPIVIEMSIVRGRSMALRFAAYSLLTGVCTLALLYFVDSHYYGKTVIAPLNIVLYNVFSKHGSTLYGTEPAAFYVKNLFLNCNVLLPFAAVSPLLSLWAYFTHRDGAPLPRKRDLFSLSTWYRFLPVALLYSTMVLWLLIFFAQPHKEERFLFPLFPLISLLAAICLDSLMRFSNKFTYPVVLVVCTFLLFSCSRAYALHRNYSGAMEAYRGFHDHLILGGGSSGSYDADGTKPIRLCVGKEWHRYQSSFFLPHISMGNNGSTKEIRVEMQFLRSEFKGLLPKQFPPGRIPDLTRQIPTAMNDENREEESRYVDPGTCDFIIDLDRGQETVLEPDYSKKERFRTIVVEKPFLITAKSHPLFRAFYVPFTSHTLTFGYIRVLSRSVL